MTVLALVIVLVATDTVFHYATLKGLIKLQ